MRRPGSSPGCSPWPVRLVRGSWRCSSSSASRSSRSRGRCSGATSPARSAAWSASGSTGCRAGCRAPCGPASTAPAVLLGLGTVLVVVMVVARWSTVSGLHAAVNAGLVGGVVLTAAQLLVLPNLAVFALAWLAGPGFQIADGSTDHPRRRPPRPDADDPGPGRPSVGRRMVRMAHPAAIRAGARRRRHRVARVPQPGPTVELADQARHRPRGRRDLGRRPHRARRTGFGRGGRRPAQRRRHAAAGVRSGAASACSSRGRRCRCSRPSCCCGYARTADRAPWPARCPRVVAA